MKMNKLKTFLFKFIIPVLYILHLFIKSAVLYETVLIFNLILICMCKNDI